MLPGVKKAPKMQIAAILEPSDDGLVNGGSTLAEGEEDNSSDTDELGKQASMPNANFDWSAIDDCCFSILADHTPPPPSPLPFQAAWVQIKKCAAFEKN